MIRMQYKVERIKFVTRECLRANPDKIFLFGDNLERRGYGGQAREMRGEPNSIGVPTKKSPSYRESAFFTDDEFEENKLAIDRALTEILRLARSHVIAIPEHGLGTGRAQLDKRAPRTFAYLKLRLAELLEAE